MSLTCNECNQDIQPSTTLPGREGTLVHPNILAFAYTKMPDGKLGYQLTYLEAQENRSLCLECVDKELPAERKENMVKLYGCYNAETKYRKIEEDQKGKWLDMSDKSWSEAYRGFERKRDKLDHDCIFCGHDVKGESRPFFHARTIDRAYSGQHLSGIPAVGLSYSWSNVNEGQTSLRICFQDFMDHFPRTFEQLSYDLTGGQNPNSRPLTNEVYISKEFMDAAKNDGVTIEKIEAQLARPGTKIILDKRIIN